MTDDGLLVRLAFLDEEIQSLKRMLSRTSADKTELLALYKIKTQQKNKLREALAERGYTQQ